VISLPVLISSSYFFSLVQLKRGLDRAALVGTWHAARLTTTHAITSNQLKPVLNYYEDYIKK